MNKRASLSLSITAIVVIVIAFVVLGLGLTLTRTIFAGAESKIPEAIALTQLEAEPTSENSITLPQTVDIDRNSPKPMQIGFYNRHEFTAIGAGFQMKECLTTNGELVSDNLPTVASTTDDVRPSDSQAYSIILNENGLPAGDYICTMAVVCKGTECTTTDDYETKQFFLKVIA
jgi:hypothetical protein